MSDHAPVGVRLGRCRCVDCMDAYRAAQEGPAPPSPPRAVPSPSPRWPRGQGRRDPRVRASQILAEELGLEP